MLRDVARDNRRPTAADHFAMPTTRPEAVDMSLAGTDSALSGPTMSIMASGHIHNSEADANVADGLDENLSTAELPV